MSPAGRPLPRPRPTRQTYLVRRVVAAGVLVLATVAAVAGFRTVTNRAAGPPPTTTSTTAPKPKPKPTTTTKPKPTTTIGPKAAFVPTPQRKAKVLIVGDSDAGVFGPYLQRMLRKSQLITSELDYKTSSGLARPDFFDWPAHLAKIIPQVRPDIVVVTFGGNDGQSLTDKNRNVVAALTVSNPAKWRAEYAKRVGRVMDMLNRDRTTVIWVGIPNGPSNEFTARLRIQDQAVRAEAKKRPTIRFVDTWNRFVGIDGGWAEFVIDPRDGQGKDVRSNVDGFHLNENGAEILAIDIADAIYADLRKRGAKI